MFFFLILRYVDIFREYIYIYIFYLHLVTMYRAAEKNKQSKKLTINTFNDNLNAYDKVARIIQIRKFSSI